MRTTLPFVTEGSPVRKSAEILLSPSDALPCSPLLAWTAPLHHVLEDETWPETNVAAKRRPFHSGCCSVELLARTSTAMHYEAEAVLTGSPAFSQDSQPSTKAATLVKPAAAIFSANSTLELHFLPSQ